MVQKYVAGTPLVHEHIYVQWLAFLTHHVTSYFLAATIFARGTFSGK